MRSITSAMKWCQARRRTHANGKIRCMFAVRVNRADDIRSMACAVLLRYAERVASPATAKARHIERRHIAMQLFSEATVGARCVALDGVHEACVAMAGRCHMFYIRHRCVMAAREVAAATRTQK